MYFINRASLGASLSERLPELRGKEAIIVCLKESALLTCIHMATKLRAWIFPLLYQPIQNPANEAQVLGAITQDGEFCINPAVEPAQFDYIQSEFFGVIEDRKRSAMQLLNQMTSGYGVSMDKHVMNGRPVLLTSDILTNRLELAIAKQLLRPLTPSIVYGVAGNTTIDVSDMFHLETQVTQIMDILPSPLGDDHYFEQPDDYTAEQKRALALNISTYWT